MGHDQCLLFLFLQSQTIGNYEDETKERFPLGEWLTLLGAALTNWKQAEGVLQQRLGAIFTLFGQENSSVVCWKHQGQSRDAPENNRQTQEQIK